MSFCKNCGNRLSENANFCDVCGTPARDSSPQSDYRNNADIPAEQSNNYFYNDFNAAPETADNETFFKILNISLTRRRIPDFLPKLFLNLKIINYLQLL